MDWSLYLRLTVSHRTPWTCMISLIYLDIMCKFITMIYSPGSKRVFIRFGWCLKTLLSCSLYSMENSELLSSSVRSSVSLHYPDHLVWGIYTFIPKLSTFQTQLVNSPYDLALFPHTDCPISQPGQRAAASLVYLGKFSRWNPSLRWVHEDRKQVWPVKDLVVDILCLGTGDV